MKGFRENAMVKLTPIYIYLLQNNILEKNS
jgi:hypothetical protein